MGGGHQGSGLWEGGETPPSWAWAGFMGRRGSHQGSLPAQQASIFSMCVHVVLHGVGAFDLGMVLLQQGPGLNTLCV